MASAGHAVAGACAGDFPPTTPELLRVLEQLDLPIGDALRVLGVTQPDEIPFLTDAELGGLNLRTVQIRQLRQATGSVDPAADIPVRLVTNEGCVPRAAGGEATPLQASDQLGAAPGVESPAWRRPPGLESKGPASRAAEEAAMVEAADGQRRAAVDALRHVLTQRPEEDVARFIGCALEGVTDEGRDPDGDAKAAADALAVTGRARASCSPGQPAREALIAAEKAVRGHFVWRTQLLCRLDDREAFVQKLRDNVADLNRDKLSYLLHVHSRVVSERFPNTFLSTTKQAAKKRGKRPRRGRDGSSGNSLSHGGLF